MTQVQAAPKVPFLKRKWVKWSGLALLAILIIIGIVAAVKAYKKRKENKELEKAGADTGKTKSPGSGGSNRPGTQKPPAAPPANPPPAQAPPQPPPRVATVAPNLLKVGQTLIAATDTALYEKPVGSAGNKALATVPAGQYVGVVKTLNPLMVENWKVKDPEYSAMWGGSELLEQTKFYVPSKHYVVK